MLTALAWATMLSEAMSGKLNSICHTTQWFCIWFVHGGQIKSWSMGTTLGHNRCSHPVRFACKKAYMDAMATMSSHSASFRPPLSA